MSNWVIYGVYFDHDTPLSPSCVFRADGLWTEQYDFWSNKWIHDQYFIRYLCGYADEARVITPSMFEEIKKQKRVPIEYKSEFYC